MCVIKIRLSYLQAFISLCLCDATAVRPLSCGHPELEGVARSTTCNQSLTMKKLNAITGQLVFLICEVAILLLLQCK